PSLNADRVVFCRGWRDSLSPWFNNIQWRPAKGQILTLRIPDFPRGPTVYANGLWLTHLADDAFLCGATYSWSRFDEGPEPEQTATLTDKLNELLTVNYTVSHVSSGTRPIVAGRQPVIGWSHRSERIGIMNGLGSKGSLYAPFIARMMTNSLINSVPVDARFDVQARFPPVCD
ncbi:MAG: FAD-dependent oxidoreductase, partial [Pseudomonadota bacterium]